uniref:Uncharacterized protein n=1 Tax=Canis lupus familiaris TaxID=9615 RepID=A0A8C0MTI5_CANLF
MATFRSIMSRLCLYLLFIFTWQPSWLLGQAAPLPAWARRTSGPRRSPEPPEPPEPWSSHSSELLHESLQALTRPAEAGGGFNNLRSSAPAQMSAPPKQLTETLVPFLDTDSNGELPPETDQYLNDKPTLHERLLQVVPALGDENQAIVLPPPLKSKMKTGDEPEDHQSLEILAPPLDSQGLNQRKFFVSSPNLDKDLVQHRRLAKVVIGTPNQFANKELLEQLQDDYSDSGMDIIYPEENRPMDFPGGPDQPPELPEELEISSLLQETPAGPLQPTEVEPWTPQEAPAQPPEEKVPPQEVNVPSLSQNEAQRPKLHNVTVKPVDLALTVTVTQPPQHPKKAEPAILQEQPAQPPELSLGEVEPIPTQQEHPAQPLEHHEVKVERSTTTKTTTPPPKDLEMTLAHLEQIQRQHPNLTEVTVPPMDLEITTPTQPPEPPKEGEVQHPESPSITFHNGGLGLTITPEPITEAKHSATTKKTTAPSPADLEVTLAHRERAYTTFTEQPEQSVTTNVNICELCTCKDETLSCTGFSPKQRLRRVPVPEPNTDNNTFTILNFQGNAISYIEENTWKPYRWTEKLILSENYLTELHKDSFEGLLSLQYLILSHNPLTTVEDSYLFKLPALKYLDMGTTQVSLSTIESILMMTLELEKLILPSRMSCCLCQLKNNIEVVCKTVKLHCDGECLTNATRCDEKASIMNVEGSFMKVLKARKKSTSTELTIEPEKASSDKNGIGLSLSSAGDLFEIQLNQQLRSLIPNNDVRRLISHVIRTLKMDCSETNVQLACAKLISRTGLLMKLLSEQQEVKVSKAEWDTDQWKTENYINESTEAQSEQKEQKSTNKRSPGYGYNNKLILAISVTVVVMILIIVFCLIEVRT